MNHSASTTSSIFRNPSSITSGPFPVSDIRFARRVEALYVLGPRATYELLTEFRRDWPQHADYIEDRVATYAALEPATVRALGADRIPRPPLTVVPPPEPEPQRIGRPHHISKVIPSLVDRNRTSGRGGD